MCMKNVVPYKGSQKVFWRFFKKRSDGNLYTINSNTPITIGERTVCDKKLATIQIDAYGTYRCESFGIFKTRDTAREIKKQFDWHVGPKLVIKKVLCENIRKGEWVKLVPEPYNHNGLECDVMTIIKDQR